MSPPLTIVPLAERPELLPIIAQWIHDEWWQDEIDGLQTLTRLLREHLKSDRIPATFIALCNGVPVGSACLLEHDVGTEEWPHLSPWIAAVYVAPAHRKQGIGAALLAEVTDFAVSLGHPAIYLATVDKEAWYQKHGWQIMDRREGEEPLIIMRR